MNDTRTVDHVARAIGAYLKRNQLFIENPPWEIKESPLGGFGVFANRTIEPGDLIFKDSPVILGPRCSNTPTECCLYCFTKSDVGLCEKKCGLLVCKACNDSARHQDECNLVQRLRTNQDQAGEPAKMTKCLTPLRSLLLNEEDKTVVRVLKGHKGDQHGREVDMLMDELGFQLSKLDQKFLRLVCSVLDANAFEVIVAEGETQTSFRGLYPLGSLANHSCYPNSFHVFDENQRMVARAAVAIEKGSEIFHSYSKLIWGTATRSTHLRKTKHFICRCNRCLDPTEFGTYMSSVLCKKCGDNLVPTDPLSCCPWKCQGCEKSVPLQDVARVFSLIGSLVKCFDDGDFELMNSFLRGKLATLVPESSQVVVQTKYRIVWILGYHERFQWKDLSADLLLLKKDYCQDILELLNKLKLGLCKMRGLLLYEIYQCLVEINRRRNDDVDDEDLSRYLNEAAIILRDDVCSPDVIKQKWRT